MKHTTHQWQANKTYIFPKLGFLVAHLLKCTAIYHNRHPLCGPYTFWLLHSPTYENMENDVSLPHNGGRGILKEGIHVLLNRRGIKTTFPTLLREWYKNYSLGT